MSKHNLVMVEWIDSSSLRGWQGVNDPSHGSATIWSAGYLVRENKTDITISTSIAENGNCADAISIPKCAIKKRKKLKYEARAAEIEAGLVFEELTRPHEQVGELWKAYVAEHRDRAVIENMHYNWLALAPHFANLRPSDISVETCRSYTTTRRDNNIQDGTINTELGRLRMVLKWAEKRALISRAPYIERPSPPRRKEHHLTREECKNLIDAAVRPHIKLFIILALATGARDSALRGLTWDRVNFERRLIDLRDPKITAPHKGRAIVPINDQLLEALQEAKERALSGVVVEWAGRAVGSVKTGLKATARAAGVKGQVSPHVFRHSAAVHMAEAGISMDEIAQYLGHEDVSVTRKVYARFSPDYLRAAANVLQY